MKPASAIERRAIEKIRDAITEGTYTDAVSALREFQLMHYAQRMEESTDDKEKSFLRAEVYRLKQTNVYEGRITNYFDGPAVAVLSDSGSPGLHSVHSMD